jgi:hypothetical protein
MDSKLRAALNYLGDRLATHRASRFKPAKHTLLDHWLAARRLGRDAMHAPPRANVEHLPARRGGASDRAIRHAG